MNISSTAVGQKYNPFGADEASCQDPMTAVADQYEEKKYNGHDPCQGHCPRTRVHHFYVQVIGIDLNAFPMLSGIEPVLEEKVKIKKLLVKASNMIGD
jgi:hypothetical protein